MNKKSFNLRVSFLLSLVFILSAFSAGFVYAKDLNEMIPKCASGVLIIDYAKNNFSDRLLKFFNKLATADDNKASDALKNSVGISFNDPVFLSTISKVAIVHLDEISKEPAENSNAPVAIIIQLAKKEAFLTQLSNLKAALSKDGRYNLYAKKDQPKIEILENAKDKSEYFAFTTEDDFFVAGTGAKTAFDAINKVLETAKDPKESILESENFKNALKAFPIEDPVYFYLDGLYIQKFSVQAKITQNLDFLKGFCFSLGLEGSKMIANGLFMTDKQNKNNAFAKYFTKEGGQLLSPAMLDGETVLFLGGKFNFDPELIKGDKELAEPKAQLNSIFGVDIDKDVISWIGDEFFFSVSNYKLLQLPVLPAPRLYLGMKVKDRDACRKCLDKVMTALKAKSLNFKENKAGEAAVFHCPIPTPGNAVPDFGITFAIVNDFLVISTAREAISELIAFSAKKETSLSASKAFAGAVGSLSKSSLFTFFYNGVLGADMLVALAKYTGTNEAQKFTEKELDVLKLTSALSGGFTFKDSNFGFRFVSEFNKDLLVKVASGIMAELPRQDKSAAVKEKKEENK